MTDKTFTEEISRYSIEELELICLDQKDLYTPEEMAEIERILAEKRKPQGKDPLFIRNTVCSIICLVAAPVGLIMTIIMALLPDPTYKQTAKQCIGALIVGALLTSLFIIGGLSF